MQVALLGWKSMPRNSLRGFATVRLGKSLVIEDVAVHCNSGRKWANLPSKPRISAGGELVRDNGKIQYSPILRWLDRTVADDFSSSVIEAVERERPNETNGDFKA